MARRVSLLVLIGTFLFAAAPAADAQIIREPGFVEQNVITQNLEQPTSVAWLPDGRMLVAEKPGRVKLFTADGVFVSQLLDISGQVNEYLDRGLLGIAVDGQFGATTNRYVYLLYTYDAAPGPFDTNAPESSRLVRYDFTAGNALTNPTIILGTQSGNQCPAPGPTVDCMPSDADTHSIGTIRAASDGTLFVGAGDGAPYQTWDPLAFRAQNEDSLAGKVLHVTREGQGISGHPFCPANANLAHVCTKLYAKGFRNPFRFTLRPGGGLVLGDVGWDTWEEIDLVSAGNNYGWPCKEANSDTPGYKDQPQCVPGTLGPVTAPIAAWDHNTGQAAIGGPEYTGTAFPEYMRNRIYVADYSAARMFSLEPNGSGGWTRRPLHDAWSGVELQQRGGDLVYVDLMGGAIRRLTYAASNRPPSAAISANPTSGTAPLPVNFSAAASADPDLDPLTYTWNFGDGSPTATGETLSHTFTTKQTSTVELTVTDPGGLTANATTTISTNPAPQITSASIPASFRIGQPVALSATATDPEGDPLTYTWRITLVHGQGDRAHNHFLPNATGASASFMPLGDHDADSHYEVELVVTDGFGGRTTQTSSVNPETSAITLASDPPGAPLTYDVLGVTAPHTRNATVGFDPTLGAAETFTSGGLTYRFARWSDGGARVHQVTVPATATTFTAVYEALAGPPAPAPPDGAPRQEPVVPPGPVTRRPRRATLSKTRLTRDARGRAVITGTVRNLPKGARVEVALARRAAGRCVWWSAARKRFTGRPRSCGTPASWLRATRRGTTFRAPLNARVPRAAYVIRARVRASRGR